MNTANKYGVSISRDQIFILNPPATFTTLTAEEALVLAAWLVALAQPIPDAPDFAAILDTIELS